MPTRHNPVARSPLLRKGGVHARSRSSERQNVAERLRDEMARYLSEQGEEGADARPLSSRRKPAKERCP